MYENSNVEKVILFGSLAKDRATAFSDVDILILAKNSTKRFIDRPMDFVRLFQYIGIEADLFVCTREEVEKKYLLGGFTNRYNTRVCIRFLIRRLVCHLFLQDPRF